LYLTGEVQAEKAPSIDVLYQSLPRACLEGMQEKRAVIIRICLSILFLDYFVMQPIHCWLNPPSVQEFIIKMVVYAVILSIFLVSVFKRRLDIVRFLVLSNMAACFYS